MSTKKDSRHLSVQREALRNRVHSFYRHFNRKAFGKCFLFIDPNLREEGKVDEIKYSQSLSDFLEYYGSVSLVITKITLYLDMKTKTGVQNFGYPLIVWKDAKHMPHLFQERWVKHGGMWFTRVVGLVSPDSNGSEEHREETKADVFPPSRISL